MTTVEVLPDVEVDESELTQQPCGVAWLGRACGKPAVGEDLMRDKCGHQRAWPKCATHIGGQYPETRFNEAHCGRCLRGGHECIVWLVVSRYYTRGTS